jgi:PhnB protein
MIRSMMQVYVKGSIEAMELYKKAFNAETVCEYKNDDGSYMHVELDVYGQILALSESGEEKSITGNTMQFCLHFGEKEKALVEKAFTVLEEGAQVRRPLGLCSYSPCMVDLIDKYGVRWCIFA